MGSTQGAGGVSQSASLRTSKVGGTINKGGATSKKISDAPTRLLKEVDVNAIY
jgi:hypothetical protein